MTTILLRNHETRQKREKTSQSGNSKNATTHNTRPALGRITGTYCYYTPRLFNTFASCSSKVDTYIVI
ncbi:hypothetical protein IV203_004964 [Nitzschia inconspicua]|uniref:Uncharacterized protein n=1 Tax=Nitzschia inconspicua TaxID=303405 RepID=A0A9K3PFQ4_9STRA|nr:hypothetical protein IV203_004964 [Nitzschia inconspicua]